MPRALVHAEHHRCHVTQPRLVYSLQDKSRVLSGLERLRQKEHMRIQGSRATTVNGAWDRDYDGIFLDCFYGASGNLDLL